MKRFIVFIAFALGITLNLNAQSPAAFNYQAIARDLSGAPLLNRNVGLRISILQGKVDGTSVYKELHLISTSNTGLFNIQIGNGTAVTGSVASINWGQGPYFLMVEMDENGGSNYKLMGTSQLLSVPYALYAESSGDTSVWRMNGNHIYYKEGNVGIGMPDPISRLHVENDSNDFATTIYALNKNTGIKAAAEISVQADGYNALSIGRLGENATEWPLYGTPGTGFI
jgi:hypothetical protein